MLYVVETGILLDVTDGYKNNKAYDKKHCYYDEKIYYKILNESDLDPIFFMFLKNEGEYVVVRKSTATISDLLEENELELPVAIQNEILRTDVKVEESCKAENIVLSAAIINNELKENFMKGEWKYDN